MTLMTLTILGLFVSTYVLHDDASLDTSKTSKQDIPSALLSISMMSYATKMSGSVVNYILGITPNLDDFQQAKSQFEISLNELNRFIWVLA